MTQNNLHGLPCNNSIQPEAGRPVGVCHQWLDHCCNGGPHRPRTPATIMTLWIILHQMNFTECNVQKNNIYWLRSIYDNGILCMYYSIEITRNYSYKYSPHPSFSKTIFTEQQICLYLIKPNGKVHTGLFPRHALTSFPHKQFFLGPVCIFFVQP